MFRSLSARILVGFLAVATVPVVAIEVWEDVASRERALREAREQARVTASTLAEELERHLQERGAALALATRLFEGGADRDPGLAARTLARIRREYPELSTVGWLDAAGRLQAVAPAPDPGPGAPPLIGQSFAYREYFRRAVAESATVTTSVYRGRGFGDQVIVAFGRALRDDAGRVRGVLQGSIDVSRTLRFNGIERDPRIRYLVTDAQRVVAMRSADLPVQLHDTLTDTRQRARWGAVLGDTGIAVLESAQWLVASARAVNGWSVYVERPMADVLRTSNERRVTAIQAALLAVTLGLAISLLLGRNIRGPLRDVMDWMRAFDVTVGTGDTPVPSDVPDEFREVMVAMRGLGTRLRASYAELQASLAEREGLNARLGTVLRDLDARVVARTAELQDALQRAETANVTKTRFLANMSHELRTPLNSVIGFSSVLQRNREGRLSASELGMLQRIHANGTHLLSLINDILDISKIEAGHTELALEEVDLPALARETLAQMEGQLAGKPVGLIYDGPATAPPVVTDFGKVRQVLVNLLGNAIKFTAQGEVVVRLETDAAGRVIALGVHDTGIGIPADRLQAIFEPFEQGDTSTARRFGGTGLGLAICRSLCATLGATLVVASTEGQGSSFRVEFGPPLTLDRARGGVPQPAGSP